MAIAHVSPDKLPCDTGGSFVVVLNDRLPSADEFSLTFRGIVTKKTISGKAVPIDTKTLMCTVGRYGEPEEVKVEVVGTPAARKIKSFKVSFLTRFQLICSFLPENTQLQAPVAVARCLKDQTESRHTMDEELAEMCRRTMPNELSYRDFFGGELDEHMGWQATLLHFAAERGLTKFATVLLAGSKGAYQALHSENNGGLTPRKIAENSNNTHMKSLFDDYESMAEGNAMPLIDYINGEELTAAASMRETSSGKHEHGKYSSMLAETIAKWRSLSPDEKEKGKRVKGIFRNWTFLRNRNKQKEDSDTSNCISSKNKKVTSSDHTSVKFAGRPLPSPPMSEDESGTSDREYEDMDTSMAPKSDGRKEKPLISVAKTDYSPGFHDPKNALRLRKGIQVMILENQGESHWIKAKVNGQIGVVPRSAIEMKSEKSRNDQIAGNDGDIQDIDNEVDAGDYQTEEYVALFEWDAERPGDLSLRKGEVVVVLEKRRNQWWRVRKSTGETGVFPETYLKKSETKRVPFVPPRQPTTLPLENHKEREELISPPPVIHKPVLTSFSKPGIKNTDTSIRKESKNIDDESHNSGSSIDSGLGAMSSYDKSRRIAEHVSKAGEEYLPTNSYYQRPLGNTLPPPTIRRNATGTPALQQNFGALQEVPNLDHGKPSSHAFLAPALPPLDYPKVIRNSTTIKNGTQHTREQQKTTTTPPNTRPQVASRKRFEKYTCIWEYEADDDTDLPLRKGDTVIITEKHNDDWWSGTCRGRKGTFPAKFVTKLET